MSKKKNVIDPSQMEMDFSARVDEYVETKTELFQVVDQRQPRIEAENEFEACIEIAASINL